MSTPAEGNSKVSVDNPMMDEEDVIVENPLHASGSDETKEEAFKAAEAAAETEAEPDDVLSLARVKKAKTGLKRMIATASLAQMSVQFDVESKAAIRKAFNVVDINGDGELNHAELETVVRILGGNPSNEEMEKLMKVLGGDDLKVDFDEFCVAVENGSLQMTEHGRALEIEHIVQVREAFDKVDADGSGSIGKDEFMALKYSIGEMSGAKMKTRQLNKIWKLLASANGCWQMTLLVEGPDDYFSGWGELPELKTLFTECVVTELAKALNMDPARVCMVNNRPLSQLEETTAVSAHAVSHRADGAESKKKVVQYRAIIMEIKDTDVNRLCAAIKSGKQHIFADELAATADVNGKTATGQTPLHVCCVDGDRRMLAALIQAGADPAVFDGDGHTPSDLAMRAGNSHFEGALVAAAAAIEAQKKDSSAVEATEFSKLTPQRAAIKVKLLLQQNSKLLKFADNQSHPLRILKCIQPNAVLELTWPLFIKGMSMLQDTQAGNTLNVMQICAVDTMLQKRIVDEKDHMANLEGLSALEKVGIAKLRGYSMHKYAEAHRTKADPNQKTLSLANTQNKNFAISSDADADFRSDELDVEAQSQTSKVADEYTEEDRIHVGRKMKMNIIRCMIAGACAALISGMADSMALKVYQPTATDDNREELFSKAWWMGFLTFQIPFMIIATFVELGWMYYDTLHTCMFISHAVGLVLWPLDKERAIVASSMVKAAFEVSNPTHRMYGIDPLKSMNKWVLLLCAFVYKAKVGLTKFVVKLVAKRFLSRAGVRGAAENVGFASLAAVPVGMMWNGVLARKCVLEARLRALGTITIGEYVDTYIRHCSGSPQDMMRVLGCSIVAKKQMHPNVEFLLKSLHAVLVQKVTGGDVTADREQLKEFGWGHEGFESIDDHEALMEFFTTKSKYLARVRAPNTWHAHRSVYVTHEGSVLDGHTGDELASLSQDVMQGILARLGSGDDSSSGEDKFIPAMNSHRDDFIQEMLALLIFSMAIDGDVRGRA